MDDEVSDAAVDQVENISAYKRVLAYQFSGALCMVVGFSVALLWSRSVASVGAPFLLLIMFMACWVLCLVRSRASMAPIEFRSI
jgi:ABC-type spermidine/putrescine transport system permease subunit I